MYLPKSKYRGGLNTPGSQFRDAVTKQDYVGEYFVTYVNEYYTGKKPSSSSRLLEPVVVEGSLAAGSQVQEPPVYLRYDVIRKDNSELALKNTLPVPLYYPKPGNVENFTRYFAIDKSTKRVVEVSKDVYLSMKSKEPKYYYPKYELKTLDWSLRSVSDNRINAAIAGLESYLKDPSQFVR